MAQPLLGSRGVELLHVSLSNSTVLGETHQHLWDQLYGWDIAWVDGHATTSQPMGHGEYLHVPSKGAIDGPEDINNPDCWYRVRCRWKPGDSYNYNLLGAVTKTTITAVRCRNMAAEGNPKHWYWCLDLTPAKEPQ